MKTKLPALLLPLALGACGSSSSDEGSLPPQMSPSPENPIFTAPANPIEHEKPINPIEGEIQQPIEGDPDHPIEREKPNNPRYKCANDHSYEFDGRYYNFYSIKDDSPFNACDQSSLQQEKVISLRTSDISNDIYVVKLTSGISLSYLSLEQGFSEVEIISFTRYLIDGEDESEGARSVEKNVWSYTHFHNEEMKYLCKYMEHRFETEDATKTEITKIEETECFITEDNIDYNPFNAEYTLMQSMTFFRQKADMELLLQESI
ncbi:hypothetical protein [Shewanella sp. UCD-KL12]|uniref:hypothetical protein n=1 Tax=Shewanella sp. UCD-KL12 TaxID=1917163 RepID=UPI000970529F|nr:hypothetical protein [Shewanella sp. UCD-KL12]